MREGSENEGMKIDFADRRKAFFHEDARREVHIDLPKEDDTPGMHGKIEKYRYGTRDAAQNWMDACSKALEGM